jgi:hypothetical protein
MNDDKDDTETFFIPDNLDFLPLRNSDLPEKTFLAPLGVGFPRALV